MMESDEKIIDVRIASEELQSKKQQSEIQHNSKNRPPQRIRTTQADLPVAEDAYSAWPSLALAVQTTLAYFQNPVHQGPVVGQTYHRLQLQISIRGRLEGCLMSQPGGSRPPE